MKNNWLMISIALLCMLLTHITAAQERAASKSITVYVGKFQQSVDAINQFIALNEGVVKRTNYNDRNFTCNFLLPINKVGALDSLIGKLGFIVNNSFNSENTSETIRNLERRNQNLRYENEQYSKQLKDTGLAEYNINDLKRRISNNIQTIVANDIQINQLRDDASEKVCVVELQLYDEPSSPTNSRISFVNMPGVEYGFLAIENPKAGVSAKFYQGATVKYMFTKGKSYFNLGVYKSMGSNKSDSTLISELFIINFGQDFYPRNFGRGRRRYFNLYTGYQVGGFVATQNNDKSSKFIYNANLSLGLEFVKTKHVLIDNKVSYFLPLNELNRHMRGILYQASFNFIF